VSFTAQSTQDAADSITLIWCHRFGRQWQKACTALAEFGRNFGVTRNSTPEVPRERKASPG
jgi:hypothetical protein